MWYKQADQAEMIKVAAAGIAAGIVTPLLALGISQLIIQPIFCHGATSDVCAQNDVISYTIAALAVGVAVTAVLYALNVYRPLLIVLAAMVALWGFGRYVDPLMQGAWLEYYAFSALLYAVAYMLFYWLLRIRHFALSILAVLVAVIAARWLLVV